MNERIEIKVLLVEDDDAEAHQIKGLLLQARDVVFVIRHTHSLKAALQLLDLEPQDIVLLDLSLPETHGYETVTEFSSKTSCPFIVLTGNDNMMMAMRTIQLGARDYLIKGEITEKPLERAICLAVGKASYDDIRRETDYETLKQLLPVDQAELVTLRPLLSRTIAALGDIRGFIADTAPGLTADIDSLYEKHNVPTIVKTSRDLMRLTQNNGPSTSAPGLIPSRHQRKRTRPKSISDIAIDVFGEVAERNDRDTVVPAEPPLSWADAMQALNRVATRGDIDDE